MSVALVESDKVGGTCLHTGCIPTKALLHAAEVADAANSGAKIGVNTSLDSIDMDKVNAYKDGVVDRLTKGLSGLIAARKIEYVEGWGTLTGPNTVQVGDRTLTGKNSVLATGSYARTLPGLEIGGPRLSARAALQLARVHTAAAR